MEFKKWFYNEIFQNFAPIVWNKKSNTDWVGSFNIKNKRYVIRMVRDEHTPWEISFDLIKGKTSTQDVTGTGDAALVFSTVLNGIKEWMRSVNPESFAISARESNRQSLYRKMLKMLPKNWVIDDLGTTFFATNLSIPQPAFSGYRDSDFSDYWDD